MFPGDLAQRHPAGPMLRKWGENGCPVEITDNWTMEQLDEAVAYGAHPSARDPIAAKALCKETMEKVDKGFATVVRWSKMRRQLLAGQKHHTKVSPSAAIPHKSRLFRLLLDLSDKGQRRRGITEKPSVNELTEATSGPNDSMDQLGTVLPRCIHAMATWPEADGPIKMTKLDIQDGFWRMDVEDSQQEQFCYVLHNPEEADPSDPLIVVPRALQMGWTKSPAFFCAATETGRDIAEYLQSLDSLPEHPMEGHMIDPMTPGLVKPAALPPRGAPKPAPASRKRQRQSDLDLTLPMHPHKGHKGYTKFSERFRHLYEVFVDDFCSLSQTNNEDELRHHSRSLLHAIHQIFPPQEADDPISYKKMVIQGEGIWDTRKELLGWIFDGLQRTIELPRKKLDFLHSEITTILRGSKKGCEMKRFESLVGKCQHAALGIPGGNALITPLYAAFHAAKREGKHMVKIHAGSRQAEALTDLRTMFKVVGRHPVHCKQLVPGEPGYIGFCDACKYGAGGVWISGNRMLHPFVWRFRFPPTVVARFEQGLLTINDLEMAGMLFAHLLLEQIVSIKHCRTACWCDNTSTVSWTGKMSSKKSKVGQQLTRALALRFCANEASPLTPLSIAGKDNRMADLPSRSFCAKGPGNYDLDDLQFLTKFNADFPLSQDASWLMLSPHTKLTSPVCMLLQGETVPAGSWLRRPKCVCAIGRIGSTTATSIEWTPCSKTELERINGLTSSPPLPPMSEVGLQVEDIRSATAQLPQRLAPSARPLKWRSRTTPSTGPTPTTSTSGTSSAR